MSILSFTSVRERVFIEQTHKTRHFRLWRLFDEEYAMLHRRSQAMQEEGFDFVSIQRSSSLNLAQIYIGFSLAFGDSGRCFDDWKGSFSFPFLLALKSRDSQCHYLLNLHDHRGYLELGPQKILVGEEADTTDRLVIRKPDALLSHEAMAWLSGFLFGLMEGMFSVVGKEHRIPFYKAIGSNLILYGYSDDGEFFDEHYEDPEQFDEALARCRQFGNNEDRNTFDLLQRITGDTETNRAAR